MNKNLKFKVFISMVLLLTLLVSLVPAVIVAETPAEGVNLTEDKKEEAKKDPPDQQGSTGEASEETSESTTEETSEETSEATTEETSEETSEATTEQTSEETSEATTEETSEETSEATTTSTTSSESSSTLPSEKVEGITPLEQPMQLTQMMPLRGPASGPYSLVSGSESTSYDSLADALVDAKAGDTIKVSGTITEAQAITITKNITLMAGDEPASITFTNPSGITVKDGASLIFGGGGTAEPLLTLSAPSSQLLVVSEGSLLLREGAKLESSLNTITLRGAAAKASISGGSVTSSGQIAIKMQDGAIIDSISGGSIKGKQSAIVATGAGTNIQTISAGSFENENNGETFGSGSCVMLSQGASIGSIEGESSFNALNGSAILIRGGGSVGTISGGVFKSSVDHSYSNWLADIQEWHYNSAISIVTSSNSNPNRIGSISGGSFQGIHAIYMAAFSNVGDNRPTIDEISGGSFTNAIQAATNFRATILVGQRSLIKKISGGTFLSLDDDRVLHVEVQYDYSGVQPDRLAEISEITGGCFTQQRGEHKEKHATVEVNIGKIGSISGGIFNSIQETIQLRQGGSLGTISGGIFNNEQTHVKSNRAWQDDDMGSIMFEDSKDPRNPINIEPDLSNTQADIGYARYRSKKPYNKDFWFANYRIFHDDNGKQVGYTFPSYTGADGKSHNYILGQYDYDYDYDYRPSGYYDNEFPAFKDNQTKGETDYKHEEKICFSTDGQYIVYKSTINPNYPLAIDLEEEQHDLYALAPYYSDEHLMDWLDASGNECREGTAGALPYRYLVKRPTLYYDKNLEDAVGNLPGPQVMLPYQNWLVRSVMPVRQADDCVFTVKKDLLTSPTHKFLGWNTKQDGSGVWIREEEWYAMPFYDVTLYAQWETTSQPPTPQPPTPQPPTFIEEEPEPTEPKLELKIASPLVFKQITGGKAATADVFSFRLEAISYEAPQGRPDLAAKEVSIPMPPDSVMGIKDVTITGEGTAAFGQLVYEEPGSYSYRITEVKGSNPNYQYATDVYTFTDYVYEENGQLLSRRSIYKNGAEANTATAYFTNHYLGAITRDKITSLPATGSADSLMPALALVALGLVIVLKKR